jgi:hypothetical protein
MLASRMPVFRDKQAMKAQHKLIHVGLDKLEAYVAECKAGKRELRLSEMGEILEGFGSVLWTHLDEEVRNLAAENMRKYWSLEDMRRFPF